MPLHRGDLNDVQWQNFTPAADKRVLVDLPLTTLAIINGIYGFTARVRRGTICRLGMGHAVRYRAVLPLALPRHLARDPESLAADR